MITDARRTYLWENFELSTQFMLAPLLANAKQKELFRETNKCHERLFLDLVLRVIKPLHFFEIGAYEASTAMRVASTLPNCTCVAFEADPDVHAHFSERHKSQSVPSNFKYEQSAISDFNGSVQLQKQVKVAGSEVSKLLPNNSLKQKYSNVEYCPVETKCQSIDNYVRGLGVPHHNVLRIDTEGLSYEVLRGAEKTLDECVAIYAEVEDYEIWQNQKTIFYVYAMLEDKGFVPVSRDVQTPGQYNVFWLRRNDALERKYRSRLSLYFKELLQISAKSLY